MQSFLYPEGWRFVGYIYVVMGLMLVPNIPTNTEDEYMNEDSYFGP